MYVNAKCPNCGCMFGTNDAKLEFEKLYINAKELSEMDLCQLFRHIFSNNII